MTQSPVIGLEIHVQLRTATKLFCGDVAAFGAPPNTHVCPVCLGLPGALPVLNAHAVTLAVRTALALGCTIAERSSFARKRYAYPDLPKGYQITQHAQPLASGGAFMLERSSGPRDVRIRRVHLEEDAARLVHDRIPRRSAIDCNRAGVALVEIVTEPDLASPAEARAFLVQLRRLLRWVGVSDCEMEKGSLRVDANVSLSAGDGATTVRTELKNMNSFAHVEAALAWEVARQQALVRCGRVIEPVTIGWDAPRRTGHVMRAKETGAAYAWTDEPDVPPLTLNAAVVAEAHAMLPELPHACAQRIASAYGLTAQTADVIASERALANYYEALAAASPDPVTAANWLAGDVLAWVNRSGGDRTAFPIDAAQLGELLQMVHDGRVSHTAARRTVLPMILEQGLAPAVAVERSGTTRVSDGVQLASWVDAVLDAHAAEVARYRAGETKVLGFLMGCVMERSAGSADPQGALRLLRLRLDG